MDLRSLNKEELNIVLKEWGLKSFRVNQIYDWFHVKLIRDYNEMTNVSKELRMRLKEEYPLNCIKIDRVQESRLDGTRKYLHRLSDGNYVESVFMRYRHGNSVCISSQVGCKIGC